MMDIFQWLRHRYIQMLTGVLCMVCLFLPFHLKFTNVCILLLVFVWLSAQGWRNVVRLWHSRACLWWLAFLLFIVLGLLYSENVKAGAYQIEKNFPALIFIVVLGGSMRIPDKNYRLIKFVFVAAVAVACGYSYACAVWETGTFYSSYDYNYYIHPFSRDGYTRYLNIHPGYFSIYILCAIMILIDEAIRQPLTVVKGIVLILLKAFFVFNLVLLASKTPLLIFFVILLLGLAVILFRTKRWYLLPVGLLVIGGVLALFWRNVQFRHRFGKEFVQSGSNRVGQIKASLLVIQEHPVFGVGTGDLYAALKEKYEVLGDSHNLEHINNSHNQYLSYAVKFGLIGLMMFLGAVVFTLRDGLRQRDWLTLSMILIICLSCITESCLERHAGLVWFFMLCGLVINRHAPTIQGTKA